MNIPLKASLVIGVLRWTAQILGTLVLALVVALGIGEGAPNPLRLPLHGLSLTSPFGVTLCRQQIAKYPVQLNA